MIWSQKSRSPRLTDDDWAPSHDLLEHSATIGTGFDALYRNEAPRLERFFGRRAPVADVADLVQESFRRIVGCRADRPVALLQHIAGNLLIERRRAGARRQERAHQPFDETQIDGDDPHRGLEARDALARVDRALLSLPDKTRNIFLLRRIQGMSYAEIAESYGMSVKGVEKQFVKAMIHLRRRVGDL